MIRTKLFFIFFILTFIFQNDTQSKEIKILFKIESEIITTIDVENEYKYLIALNKNIKNLSRKEIINISKKSIIKEKIQKIEISKKFKDPKIPNEYLEQILKSIYVKIGIKNLTDFKEYLKNNNVDYTNVKNKIETEALWNELIFAKFSSKIKIDEKKIRNEFLKNGKKFFKSYLMSEIFFEIQNANDFKKVFDSIKKTIKDKGFGNAALTHSTSNTSNVGGKLGWIKEDSLNKKLKNILSNMDKNDFTNPITVPGGFLILKIDEIKKIEKNQNINEEIKKIINTKKNNQLNQFSKMYFNKIKKDIFINEL